MRLYLKDKQRTRKSFYKIERAGGGGGGGLVVERLPTKCEPISSTSHTQKGGGEKGEGEGRKKGRGKKTERNDWEG